MLVKQGFSIFFQSDPSAGPASTDPVKKEKKMSSSGEDPPPPPGGRGSAKGEPGSSGYQFQQQNTSWRQFLKARPFSSNKNGPAFLSKLSP